jgi:hypothetical protein
MMETVLNVGLNDFSVPGLVKASGDERFVWDSYRRLIQMFGKTVLGVDGEAFAHALDAAKSAKGVRDDVGLDAEDLRELVEAFKQIVLDHTGRPFPQDPREQLDLATEAVFTSWNTDRARLYRRRERIPHDLGTAVNVCTMVFGNLGEDSGTGVCFTRDPSTGKAGAYGDYLVNAQGEDVVSGIRNTLSLDDFAAVDPAVARRAAPDHAAAGDALPRPVRHRVHRRARQAVDAADAGRQAHPGGGVPDRHPARRRAAHHHRRGARAGRWSAAGAADVPAVRRRRRADRAGPRDGSVAGCCGRARGVRLRHGGGVGGAG